MYQYNSNFDILMEKAGLKSVVSVLLYQEKVSG